MMAGPTENELRELVTGMADGRGGVFEAITSQSIGNMTTLSPIIVRREFGAESFGAVYGIAGSLIGFAMAGGAALFGAIRDASGSYGPALLLAGAVDVLAAIIIVWGRRPLPSAS